METGENINSSHFDSALPGKSLYENVMFACWWSRKWFGSSHMKFSLHRDLFVGRKNSCLLVSEVVSGVGLAPFKCR